MSLDHKWDDDLSRCHFLLLCTEYSLCKFTHCLGNNPDVRSTFSPGGVLFVLDQSTSWWNWIFMWCICEPQSHHPVLHSEQKSFLKSPLKLQHLKRLSGFCFSVFWPSVDVQPIGQERSVKDLPLKAADQTTPAEVRREERCGTMSQYRTREEYRHGTNVYEVLYF